MASDHKYGAEEVQNQTKGRLSECHKESTVHYFWHPRVEGQIKHTIGRHPEWFNLPPKTCAKQDCISSLAKRIDGEIVAAVISGNKTG